MSEEVEDVAAPTDADCCNSGCNPCVYDIYRKRLERKSKSDLATFRCDLLSETKFKPFRIIEKRLVRYDVYLFTFQPEISNVKSKEVCKQEPVHIDGVLQYKPGQHFILKQSQLSDSSKLNYCDNHLFNLPTVNSSTMKQNSMVDDVSSSHRASEEVCDNGEGKRHFLTRAYTPISLSNKEMNCCFDMIIKIYSNGKMSNYLNNLSSGDTVYFRGPYGDFEYAANKYKRILMFCIGTGIAPFYPIIKSILDNENDETIIKLVYGCRNVSHILLHDCLTEMALYWNFSVDYYLSSIETKVEKIGENLLPGRIGEKAVLNELNSQKSDGLAILICGTDKFNGEVMNILSKSDLGSLNVSIFK